MALRLLEEKIGREEVLKLVESEGKIDFNHYPHTEQYVLSLREKVNQKIKEATAK
jgi:hypothetical protein